MGRFFRNIEQKVEPGILQRVQPTQIKKTEQKKTKKQTKSTRASTSYYLGKYQGLSDREAMLKGARA